MSKQTKIQTRKTTAAMTNSASQTDMLVAVGDQPSPPVATAALIREVTNRISEVIETVYTVWDTGENFVLAGKRLCSSRESQMWKTG